MDQGKPLRVLVMVTQKSPLWTKACDSPEDVLPAAIQLIKDKHLYDAFQDTTTQPDTRLLFIEKRAAYIFLVFDISNKAYDPEKGHLPEQNNLPVIFVYLGIAKAAFEVDTEMSQQVNKKIADLHKANGVGSLPPFVEDFTLDKPPEYPNPRNLLLKPFIVIISCNHIVKQEQSHHIFSGAGL